MHETLQTNRVEFKIKPGQGGVEGQALLIEAQLLYFTETMVGLPYPQFRTDRGSHTSKLEGRHPDFVSVNTDTNLVYFDVPDEYDPEKIGEILKKLLVQSGFVIINEIGEEPVGTEAIPELVS